MRLTVTFFLLASLLIRGEELKPDAAVVELRATIGKIVDTQAQASRELTDWESRKAEMAALLDLHRRELALLSEELEKAGRSANDFDERKRAADEEMSELREARRLVKETVAAAKPRMLAIAGRLPQPLLEETANERLLLEGWTPESEARDGLQAMLGIIAKAETFNRRFTRNEEVRDGREVEVLYLGLARAYYADRSGNAGVGVPGADGWQWTPRPELSDELRKAFDQLDRRRPPEMVDLPVSIPSKGGGE